MTDDQPFDEVVARLRALAHHVWEEEELAEEFLRSPQPQVDGERPIDLARRSLQDAERVERLLWKLEWSLPC